MRPASNIARIFSNSDDKQKTKSRCYSAVNICMLFEQQHILFYPHIRRKKPMKNDLIYFYLVLSIPIHVIQDTAASRIPITIICMQQMLLKPFTMFSVRRA